MLQTLRNRSCRRCRTATSAGEVDLTRKLRNGRDFEHVGEDPPVAETASAPQSSLPRAGDDRIESPALHVGREYRSGQEPSNHPDQADRSFIFTDPLYACLPNGSAARTMLIRNGRDTVPLGRSIRDVTVIEFNILNGRKPPRGSRLIHAIPTRRRIGNCGPRPQATSRRSPRTSSTRCTTTRTRAPRPLRSPTCTIRSASPPASVPGRSWVARSPVK